MTSLDTTKGHFIEHMLLFIFFLMSIWLFFTIVYYIVTKQLWVLKKNISRLGSKLSSVSKEKKIVCIDVRIEYSIALERTPKVTTTKQKSPILNGLEASVAVPISIAIYREGYHFKDDFWSDIYIYVYIYIYIHTYYIYIYTYIHICFIYIKKYIFTWYIYVSIFTMKYMLYYDGQDCHVLAVCTTFLLHSSILFSWEIK